jgi:hypothetical protein
MKKKEVMIILVTTILALAIAGWANYDSLSGVGEFLTGRVTGTVNLTVTTSASYNLTVDTINWSSGQVTSGEDFAILDTSNGTVAGGNWTPVSQGFVIENDGNVDLIINISFGKTATVFLGGTSPSYKYNITSNEAGSCNASSGFTLGDFNEVALGSIGVCSNFTYNDTQDEIRIDFQLKIPSDAYMDSRGDTLSVWTGVLIP